MRTKQIVRIVLCSPGDVEPERLVMETVIKELNAGIAEDRNLHLELNRWETDAYPGFHPDGPQGIIDPILNIEDCEVLLGIFWKRFGSPTKDARSGTDHEIRTAIQSYHKQRRPQVMIYFKESEYLPHSEEELEQHKLVLRFRSEFPREGFYWTFKDGSEFERQARNHLARFIRSRFDLTGAASGSSPARADDQALIRDYCRGLQDRFSSIHLFGRQRHSAGAGESAIDRMASIERGFVPMHLSDWRETFNEGDAEPIEIEGLFTDNVEMRRLLVRGSPGGGKSTLLRWLGHRFAALTVESGKVAIPVYLRLRHFQCSKTTLEEFVCQEIDAVSDSQEMCDALCDKKRLLDRPTVLLLDGLDEIEDRETADKIAGLLDDFAKDHPRCRIIVTSRPIGLKRTDYRLYRALDLLPLSPEMIDDYLARWFAGHTEPIAGLQQIFAQKPRIRSLAANPFLLSMICYTYEGRGGAELIERRSQLYERCTRYLLERPYDLVSDGSSPIDYGQALEFLKDLSLRFFLWQEADFALDHVNVIGRLNPTAATLGKTEMFLNRLQRQTGLVQRVKDGYTFVHRSLWEYFTALALLDKRRDYVIRHAANPDWEEVVRLYAGLLPRDDEVKALVNGLWSINRPLALRVTTEVKTSAAELIQPLIEEEEGNQGRILLIRSLEQSLPLVADGDRRNIVEETLRIMLLECSERDCQVIYQAQMLLQKMGLKPLQPGGVIHALLDLASALTRQKDLLNDPANCFEWVAVEGGCFPMGDDHHADKEKPAHRVELETFFMAKHPVTNFLLSTFPFGEKYPQYGGGSHPAVGNTWWEAYYFALWLGARLPTEAEWEYAARGGREARPGQYFFGDDEDRLSEHAWFGETGSSTAHGVDEINPRTGKENLNTIGLSNMHGNVWEWVEDDWHTNYEGSPDDGHAWIDNRRGSFRVIRGGGWDDGAASCRSAYRVGRSPGVRDNFLGFRLSRSVAPGP